MAPSRRPPTITWRSSMSASLFLSLPLRGPIGAQVASSAPLLHMRLPGGAPALLPRLHRPFQFGGRRAVGPDQLVGLILELDQVGRGQNVLAGLVELDALIAHHQLLRLEIGLSERFT